MKINANKAHPHGAKPIKPQMEIHTKALSAPGSEFGREKHFKLRPPPEKPHPEAIAETKSRPHVPTENNVIGKNCMYVYVTIENGK